jgi:hypothetical protein
VRAQSGCILAALTLAACTVPAHRPAAPPSAPPSAASVAELAAEIDADARKSDHESDAQARAQLAADARRDADACIAQAPQAPACLFGSALALGLEARAHPAHAPATLKDMLATLARAEALDPAYEDAGPARVQALVLARAPPWPLGPGDPEQAVASARRAVALRPAYPPNWLALAEAQSKAGSAADAEASYGRARDAARALPESPDRTDWLQQAEQHAGHSP